MSDKPVSANSPVRPPAVPSATSTGKKPERVRRVYEYKMTERDRFALQTVLKAKGALTSAAIAIQEGKGCNADLLKSCLELQAHAAELLFSE